MIKNTKSMKRLSLSTQTVRALDAGQLAQANGGLIIWGSSACGSGVSGCSAKCNSEAHLSCGTCSK